MEDSFRGLYQGLSSPSAGAKDKLESIVVLDVWPRAWSAGRIQARPHHRMSVKDCLQRSFSS